MTKILKQFDVGAPPSSVFALTSKPEKYPQWAPFVKQASSNGPKTHWVYQMGGMNVESDTEVIEAKENSVYEFRQTNGFLKSGEFRLEIKPTEKGSSVIWTVAYEPPYSYLGKVMDKLRMRKQFEESVDESVKNLKKLLER